MLNCKIFSSSVPLPGQMSPGMLVDEDHDGQGHVEQEVEHQGEHALVRGGYYGYRFYRYDMVGRYV